MNKEKFTSQDIIDAVSTNNNRYKQTTELFLKNLIAVIEETLLAKEFVKIKNLGTFKLIWIAPRKSVNIQNGEEITINGYYKVGFMPEAKLKLAVNKPYSHLENIILDQDESKKESSPLHSLSEQASEIKGLLSEIETMPKANNKTTEEKKEKTKTQKINSKKKELDEAPKTEEKKEKRKTSVLFLISLLLVLIGTSLYLYNKGLIPPQEETRPSSSISTPIEQKQATEPESTETSNKEKQQAEEFERIFAERLNDVKILKTVRLEEGERLAYLSTKYYGSFHFWIYIYEFNKDRIPNQNKIPVGTTIKIPDMDPRLIDANSERCIERAEKLANQYKKN